MRFVVIIIIIIIIINMIIVLFLLVACMFIGDTKPGSADGRSRLGAFQFSQSVYSVDYLRWLVVACSL